MAFNSFDERIINTAGNAIAGTSAAQTVTTISTVSGAARLDVLVLTTDSLVDLEVGVAINDGYGDVAVVGTVKVPAGAGQSDTVPPVSAMAALGPLLTGILLPVASHVDLLVPATLVTAKTLWYYAQGGYF